MSKEPQYKMDRTAFNQQSHVEEEKTKFFGDLDYKECLRIAAYLNSVAFGYLGQEPPKMDRTAFSIRKRS